MKSTLTAAGLLGSVIVLSLSSRHLSGAEVKPKATLEQARAAVKGHHLPEAVAAYEKLVADASRDAARYKADAMYELLLLRVSADAAARDLPRGAAMAEELQRAYPTHPHAQEIAALGDLLHEVDRRAAEERRLGEQRLAESEKKLTAASARADNLSRQLTAAKEAATATSTGQLDEAGKLRKEATAMRAEIRNLRDQLAKTHAELQRKDEALKKVAGSLMKPR